jgi:potassium-dependent mechanosensitive channel
VAVAEIGRGVAIALFAPGEGARRIIPFADPAAESYAAHLSWATAAFGLTVFLNVLHRASGAPLVLIVATGALFAFAVLAIAMHLLWRSARADFHADDSRPAGARLPWLRGAFWPIAGAMAIALVMGYVALPCSWRRGCSRQWSWAARSRSRWSSSIPS